MESIPRHSKPGVTRSKAWQGPGERPNEHPHIHSVSQGWWESDPPARVAAPQLQCDYGQRDISLRVAKIREVKYQVSCLKLPDFKTVGLQDAQLRVKTIFRQSELPKTREGSSMKGEPFIVVQVAAKPPPAEDARISEWIEDWSSGLLAFLLVLMV